MDENELKAAQDFLKAAKRAYECGIQTGTGGNISVRIPGKDQMLVKASGVSFGNSSIENLVLTDFDGNVIRGGKPTQEFVLHGALYRKYSNIGGIVHTHSPWAILCSLNNDKISLVTKHSELKLKNVIPVANVESPAVTQDEVPIIYELFEKDPNLSAFVLKGHGIVSVSKDACTAEEVAELVEETAQIFWNNRLFNIINSINK